MLCCIMYNSHFKYEFNSFFDHVRTSETSQIVSPNHLFPIEMNRNAINLFPAPLNSNLIFVILSSPVDWKV